MRQTKDQQVKEIVVGLALGVLAQSVHSVTSGKQALEFGFNHAWRSWPQASEFPSIGGFNPGNLIWIGMGKSEGRLATCAFWTEGRWATPHIRYDSWTLEDALDHHSSTQVSADDWTELGRLFVESFTPGEVIRE
ncbi:hypothetical protein FIV50_12750 [Microbacterium foliorum]|uniref:Uncharacterized protein n=1 Tax=Microbacterium foliorum TaxID=104336 RepID=A0A4Y5YS64_9MICO|nr:hypothetical protein [Microbacterium foliorum]QDE35577.1 hypothetical protein FIV50_12750 [Microbacterium foliorum]